MNILKRIWSKLVEWNWSFPLTPLAPPEMTLDEAKEEIKLLRRHISDYQYMLSATVTMLGENGLKVFESWKDAGVQRVHYDWNPDSAKMTGEERAEFILSLNEVIKTGKETL